MSPAPTCFAMLALDLARVLIFNGKKYRRWFLVSSSRLGLLDLLALIMLNLDVELNLRQYSSY